MTLKNDTSTAAKMVACSELIRRLEQRGIEEVLPETKSTLDGEGENRVATAYIKIDDDGPREYITTAVDLDVGRREEDDVHPQSFAFAITVGAGEDLTQNAIDAARSSLRGLLIIHGEER